MSFPSRVALANIVFQHIAPRFTTYTKGEEKPFSLAPHEESLYIAACTTLRLYVSGEDACESPKPHVEQESPPAEKAGSPPAQAAPAPESTP